MRVIQLLVGITRILMFQSSVFRVDQVSKVKMTADRCWRKFYGSEPRARRTSLHLTAPAIAVRAVHPSDERFWCRHFYANHGLIRLDGDSPARLNMREIFVSLNSQMALLDICGRSVLWDDSVRLKGYSSEFSSFTEYPEKLFHRANCDRIIG